MVKITGAKTREDYRRIGILNPCLCEFCHLGFTSEFPNMGTHRDYHAHCEKEAEAEGHDITFQEPEPYQRGMEIEL